VYYVQNKQTLNKHQKLSRATSGLHLI